MSRSALAQLKLRRSERRRTILERLSKPQVLGMINEIAARLGHSLGVGRSSIGLPYGVVLRPTSGEGGEELRIAS